MNLIDAIEHAREAAQRLREEGCVACAEEHEQLALRLEELSKRQWIPVTERLPKAEADVEITCVREHYRTGEPIYFTARAFYESGVLTTEDSNFYWEDANTCWEYAEEKDAYVIPEGWWESVSFSDSFQAVDAKVIAWMPLPEPYCEPAQNGECEIEIQQPGRWLETV